MSRPSTWPFMAGAAHRDALGVQREQVLDAADAADETDEAESPYCKCDNEPTMNEEFSRKCSSCGKPLIS